MFSQAKQYKKQAFFFNLVVNEFFYLDVVSLLMSSPDNLLNKLARTPVDNNKHAIR